MRVDQGRSLLLLRHLFPHLPYMLLLVLAQDNMGKRERCLPAALLAASSGPQGLQHNCGPALFSWCSEGKALYEASLSTLS